MHRRTAWLALLTVLIGLVLVGAGPQHRAAAAPVGAELTSTVDEFLSAYRQRHGLPGVSVALTRGPDVLHTTAQGHQSDGSPLSADTPMWLGSVSKTFTAFSVLQLVQDGSVDLDQPVTRYVADFALDDPRSGQITVRDLLTHRSGVPSPTLVGGSGTLEESVALMRSWPLESDPGTDYLYSNFNFRAAALLVQRVTGQPFEQVQQERLFAPLGMTSTRSVVTSTDAPEIPEGSLTAYGTAFAAPPLDQVVSGSGGVITTAEDMARWLAMQGSEGALPDGRQLLRADLVTLARTPAPDAGTHAFGWDRSGPSTTPARIAKAGALTGSQAQHTLVPGSDLGVAVMLNSYTTTFEHAWAITDGIIAIAEGREPEVGAPVPTLIDAGLGLLTLVSVGLGIRRVIRSRRWADRRLGWPLWRRALRLLPQLIAPAAAVGLFVVAPAWNDNSSTPADAFWLYPAGAILLIVGAVVGLVVTGVRVGWMQRLRPNRTT